MEYVLPSVACVVGVSRCLAASSSRAHPDAWPEEDGRRWLCSWERGGYREWRKRPVVGLLVGAPLPWPLTSVSLPWKD